MHLLIDVGNTQIKYCFSDGESLSEIKRCDKENFDHLLSEIQGEPEFVLSGIIICAVSSKNTVANICAWAESHSINCQILATEQSTFGLVNSYQDFQTMGVDRWIAVLGAEQLYPGQNIIIVDSGTATTIDVIGKDKHHLGGWIIPGVELMKKSLFAGTDKVFGQFEKIDKLEFGTSTSNNVSFGCWSASVAAVEMAKSLTTLKLSKPLLIFTGGNGDDLNRLGNFGGSYIDNLIFVGMQRFI